MRLGWMEVLVIMALVLLLFGARKLPELGRSVGQAIRQFQDAMKGKDEDGKQPPQTP